MNNALSLIVGSLLLISASGSYAETTTATPVATPAAVATIPATAPTTAVVASSVKAELKDGTKIEFESDGVVSVIAKDGSKSVAPDGILTLKDGTSFTVKAGKRVAE